MIRALRSTAASLAALVVVATGAMPSAASAGRTPSEEVATVTAAATPTLSEVRRTVLQQTNAERIARGLDWLRPATWMNNRAQVCSQYQADARSMFHCPAPSSFGRAWAENVAAGQRADAVVAAWMASPGHRANMLDPRFTEMGIGYVVDSAGRTHFTQNFRQP